MEKIEERIYNFQKGFPKKIPYLPNFHFSSRTICSFFSIHDYYQFLKHILYFIMSMIKLETLFHWYQLRIILLQYVFVCTTYRENMYDIYFYVQLYNSLNKVFLFFRNVYERFISSFPQFELLLHKFDHRIVKYSSYTIFKY